MKFILYEIACVVTETLIAIVMSSFVFIDIVTALKTEEVSTVGTLLSDEIIILLVFILVLNILNTVSEIIVTHREYGEEKIEKIN